MGAQDESRSAEAAAQTPLVLASPLDPDLSRLQPGPNAAALAACAGLLHPQDGPVGHGERGGSVCLWGLAGTGKTFWIRAWARELGERGRARWHWQPEAWPDLDATSALARWRAEGQPWVLVDDLHALPMPLQGALFALWVEGMASGLRVLSSSRHPPGLLVAEGRLRADLGSRIAQGLVMELRGLDDGESLLALRLQAHRLGWMAQPEDTQFDEVFRYLLARMPRQLSLLAGLLEAIDRRALSEQRRVTVPLVRATLESLGPDGLSSAP